MKEFIASVAALIFVCLVSYVRVGLRDRADGKTSGRPEKYTRLARKLAREYRDDNREAGMIETESVIALPSIAFFVTSGVIVAIVTEFAMSGRKDDVLYWLNGRIADPFGVEFTYVEPVLAVAIVLTSFWIAFSLTSCVAEVYARIIAEKRLRKGRTVRFVQRRCLMEIVEVFVASAWKRLIGRRNGREDADSEEGPVTAR